MNTHVLTRIRKALGQTRRLVLAATAVISLGVLAIGPALIAQQHSHAQQWVPQRCATCATGHCSHAGAAYGSAGLPPLVDQRHDDAPIVAGSAQNMHAFNPYLCGVEDGGGPCDGEPSWEQRGPIAWQSVFAQGEYIGPARTQHVPVYRLRVGDALAFTFRIDREIGPEYKLNVNDEVRVESAVDKDLDRSVTIAPDGTIMLPYVDSVMAANRSVRELREELEKRFKKYYVDPSITVTPIRMGSKLDDLRNAVDARQADAGGLGVNRTVMPDGSVSLPAIGQVPAQGLTIEEMRREVNERYREIVEGLDVTPDLGQKAPSFAYVLGEVNEPQRIELDRPTTVMMALAQAGGERIGGNTRQIVVFRRTHDWRLIATKVDLQGAIWGKKPVPSDDLYLRNADIVLVPKRPIQIADDFINLIFVQGVYGLIPNQGFSITSTF